MIQLEPFQGRKMKNWGWTGTYNAACDMLSENAHGRHYQRPLRKNLWAFEFGGCCVKFWVLGLGLGV